MAKTIKKLTKPQSVGTPALENRINRRVAAYARVSTGSEQQQSSIEAQQDYYTKMINFRLDWIFAGLYVDNGISGTQTKHRTSFNQMLQDAHDGKIDLIITKSISRFARNTVDSLSAIRLLKEHGVEIFFEKENIWTFDSKGELMLTILSSVAQEESRSISENITWGKRKRFADGEYSIPYSRFLGYNRGMVINPAEAKVIKSIYFLFLLGMSSYQIANLLTDYGILTPAGKDKWNAGAVRSILTNEKYKGDALIQKNFTVDFMSKKKKKNEGELPMYYVTEGHEAIIPPPLHEYIQVELSRRLDFKYGRYCGIHPFLGRIFCEKCGAAYRYSSWHSTTYKDWVWECSSRWRGQKCGNHHIYASHFQTLLRQVMAMAFLQRMDIQSELDLLIEKLPGMTTERCTLASQALHSISGSIHFDQADAIIAIKTIHIGSQRKMRVTFLDDVEIIIDISPFVPRKNKGTRTRDCNGYAQEY